MVMEKGGDMAASAANNSSDFVRKLYKMLEDPSYESIVRWGANGDSFVVLENEKFTKLILPKHFKHSNFASFVRQLNKYDFHKVRQTNEDNGPSPYGPNAWEFKHPEFQANKKDSLDNIRRKAPAPRKAAQNSEDPYPAHQMDLVNSQLMATQQQLQSLQERYADLANGHVVLLQQVVHLQKFIKNHEQVMHRVMGFLHVVDAQRRSSRIGFSAGAPMAGGENMDGPVDDHPASPLQQASELLEGLSADTLPSKDLEQMTENFHIRTEFSTPSADPGNNGMPGPSHDASRQMAYTMGNDLDTMVYPVGHTNGIDPINSEHINNIPYGLPGNNGLIPVDAMPNMMDEPQVEQGGRKKSMQECPWGIAKPRILLVEDDRVCARIGSKFLQSFECGVETARDGLEAVNKINNAHGQFDLVFMDIIMPNLDGVSATVCIRETQPNIPIIAMTSNIRADDIDMYFRYGMNDVLPKPFTKEGMLRALEKQLPQFKKSAQNPGPSGFTPQHMHQQPQHTHPFPTSQPPTIGLSMAQLSQPPPPQQVPNLKDDTSPGKSPVSWTSHSPLPGVSPISAVGPGGQQQGFGGGPFAMGNPYPQQQQQAGGAQQRGGASQGQHRRVMSDLSGATGVGVGADEHADKRQRMFPPGAF